MNASLTFEYEFSREDDFGWLKARVETADFSGLNGAWVQWQDVVEFGETLARCPIAATDPVIGQWGFGENGKYVVVTKVAIAPAGSTGSLIVDVEIANYYEPTNRCQIRFDTDYPSVTRFREQIEAMMRKEAPTAALCGTQTNVS